MAQETGNVEQDQATVEVNEARLPEAEPSSAGGGQGQIDLLLDASVPISVVLGETTMTIRDLLQSGSGSVIALDKRVGEPLDVYVRGTPFARGELVVVGEQLGIRIKEVFAAES